MFTAALNRGASAAAFAVFLCPDVVNNNNNNNKWLGAADRRVDGPLRRAGRAGGRYETMEEFIGGLWHRFITRAATRSYPQAAVRLEGLRAHRRHPVSRPGGDPACAWCPRPRPSTAPGAAGWQPHAHVGEKSPTRRRDDETPAPARRDRPVSRAQPGTATSTRG